MHSSLLLPMLALVAPFLTPAQQLAAWTGPDQSVYVATRNHYAEGFTENGPTAQFGDLILIEIYNPDPQPLPDPKAAYKVGQEYRLFIGGKPTGYAKVEKVVPLQCSSFAGVFSANGDVLFSESTMALATNATGVRSHQNLRRDPGDQESARARRIVTTEFRKSGVPDSAIADIQADRLYVTRFAEDGPAFLIGSFSLTVGAVRHDAFLIADLESSQPSPELIHHYRSSDPDGKDSTKERFVDQLDLDGDGMDEIVVEVTGYESEGFLIYKHQGQVWTEVWSGGQGGC
jgi:hypothetical protein